MFYFMFEQEIQIWPKVLMKNVSMQCTKMKAHTEAAILEKLPKLTIFIKFK